VPARSYQLVEKVRTLRRGGFVADGLRAAVSADELRQWCKGDDAD